MRCSDCLDRLFPAMAAAFLSGQRGLQLFQLLLCFAKVARVIKKLTRGERRKMGHSQVNAHILAAKAGVPVLPFSFDREGFDRACHIPVQVEFECPNLRECNLTLTIPLSTSLR